MPALLKPVWVTLTCLALLISATAAQAQPEPKADAEKEKENASGGAESAAEKPLSITNHSVKIGGREVRYTATTGTMAQRDDAGKTKANLFFVAYTRQDTDGEQPRPLTFCFNGGPGSSSVWLHLGMLGPRRIKLPDDATPLQPPYRLEDNPHSLLDLTDLVFIDPVSTGFSRPAQGEKKDQFHGFDEDVRSVAQFIHDYTTQFDRWDSPKLLIGESYGGVRAAGLAGELQSRYRLELNGIIVVSGVVNFQTIRFAEGNDLPYVLFLPTYAATAWYHQMLDEDLQNRPLKEVVAMAEEFAAGDYHSALFQGAGLSEMQRKSVAKRYAKLTGLPAKFILDAHLRVSMSRFGKQLLRKKGQTIGRFDGRYRGRDRDNVGDRYSYDASGAAIFGPFTATVNHYVRGELEYDDPRVYEILTGKVHPWSYKRYENQYLDASETLRQTMTANPYLKLFAACGYYDLATPHYAMDYTLNHLALAPELQKNVTRRYYEAGHMMYVHEPSMKRLRADLEKFYAKSIP